MADGNAFGVNQDISITPVSTARGNDVGISGGRDFRGVANGLISDLSDQLIKDTRLRKFTNDITDKQNQLEVIAAGGNAAELFRAQRGMERDLIKAHPDYANNVKGLLDQFGDVRTTVGPDGQQYLTDRSGNILNSGPQKQQQSQQASLTGTVNGDATVQDITQGLGKFSANFPGTADAGSSIIQQLQAPDGSLDHSKHDFTSLAPFFNRVNSIPDKIDQNVKNFRLVASRAASLDVLNDAKQKAVVQIHADAIDGLDAFDMPMLHGVLSDTSNKVTPVMVSNMMHQYVNDITHDMSASGTFQVLGIDPNTFQASLRTLVETKQQQFQASFNNDENLQKRLADIAEFKSTLIKNNSFLRVMKLPGSEDMLDTSTRTQLIAPITNLFNVIEQMGAASTYGGFQGSMAQQAMSWIMQGTDAKVENINPTPNYKNPQSVKSFIANSIGAIKPNNPMSLQALLQAYNQKAAVLDAMNSLPGITDAEKKAASDWAKEIDTRKARADAIIKSSGGKDLEGALDDANTSVSWYRKFFSGMVNSLPTLEQPQVTRKQPQ